MSTDSKEGCLLGCGNPLLDISADVEDDILKKYDVSLNNAILAEDKHKPMYDELIKNYKVKYIAGGATQNSIRVAQWMLQAPKATSYIGCVGKDAFADTLRKCAEADGVAVHYLEDEKVETGTCAVLIKDKERSLIANLAAANCYKKEHLDTDTIKPVWTNAKYLYIAGFFLTVSPDSINFLGEHCNNNGKTFAMNLSAPFICQFFKDPLLAGIGYCDYVFGNESEAEAFGKTMGYEDCSVANVALEISKIARTIGDKPRICVITQGAESTVVATEGKVTEYKVPPLEADKIIDSNGAGDAFVGGFLAALINGKDMAGCCDAGNYAASVILQVSGTELSGTPSYKF
jgi:adenosine kinase